MNGDFRLLMVGAMYENGGNTTHRFLDGHPQLYVYPFESQMGTRLVVDHLSSMYPQKYRWPVFALEATPMEDYQAIIDEECKVRARTPQVSKFRHVPFDFDDHDRAALYSEHVLKSGRSRTNNVEAFFRATFEAWKNHRVTGREQIYVGYSPIITVDAGQILSELPKAHLLHVVRNPWSAYADTKKRPVPLSLQHYMLGWTQNQYFALLARENQPSRVHLVRVEDVMTDPIRTFDPICRALGIETSENIRAPSWNGEALDEVYPWGTIRRATPEANSATARELSREEQDEIRALAWQYLEVLGYTNFLHE